MKKLILFTSFFVLFGCEVGNFSEDRIKLHEKHNSPEICKTNPERCTNGVPW